MWYPIICERELLWTSARHKILPWKVGINSVLLLDSYKTHDPLEANLGREPVLFLS